MFHPAACLVTWALFAVAVQAFGALALAVASGLLIVAGYRAARQAVRLIRRAKWLLLSLWLILAYGTPGDLWRGMHWAPTIEGLELANLHVWRLLLLLASLAWLLRALPHERFMAGLWVLLCPMRGLGATPERTVARLALVFDYLEHAPPRGSWRNFLDVPDDSGRLIEAVSIDLPIWRARDIALIGLTLAGCVGLGMIG